MNTALAAAFRFSTALVVLTALSACAAQSKRTPAPAVVRTQHLYAELTAGLESYSSADYRSAAATFDRLLAGLAPSDSQLAFIGLYYGLRARIEQGLAPAADSLFGALEARVPERQRPELERVLGRKTGENAGAEESGAICRRIGAVLPLSGRFADFGQAILEGVKMALDRFNESQPEAGRVSLLVQDDRSDPLRSASLGRQLAGDSTVAALIGSYQDEATLALGLVAAANRLPLVSPTADAPSLNDLGPMVHAINRTDPDETLKLASFAVHDLGLQIFAILAPANERGARLAGEFSRAVHRAGGVVVSSQSYPADASSFDSQMTLLQRYLPDAIYIPADPNDITQLASQVHYFGLGQARILGTELWRNERILRMGGEYVDGALFASPFFEGAPGLQWKDFTSLYERTYRRPVNKYSALGYDCAALLLDAAGHFPINRQSLAAALDRVRDFPGAYGEYSLDSDGRVERKTYILELEGGEVVQARVPAAESPTAAEPATNASPPDTTAR